MAITFHMPHPHLPGREQIARHQTLIFVAAAALAVATLLTVQRTSEDVLVGTTSASITESSEPALTKESFLPLVPPNAVESGAIVGVTGEFLGALELDTLGTDSSMAVFGTDNPSFVAMGTALMAGDTGEFLGAFETKNPCVPHPSQSC
ncbi:MAG: hypothetical protein ACN4GZ_13670 [Acidimicrobiales bacterium]